MNHVLFKHYQPPPPLAELVELFWYFEGQDLLRGKEYVLPTGTVELVINLDSGRSSDSVVSGPQSKHFLIENSNVDRLLGIHFKPGGAFPFLPFSFGELHNLSITLSDLWGESRANQLLSLLHEADAVNAKFQILERWLLLNRVHPGAHRQEISFAMSELQSKPGISTARLAERVNLSQRRFIELFRNQIGLTPKLFSRVQRFQGVLDQIEMQLEVDWVEVAMHCGYFDQAHFIHDFREFSGLIPTKYLLLKTDDRNHLPNAP